MTPCSFQPLALPNALLFSRNHSWEFIHPTVFWVWISGCSDFQLPTLGENSWEWEHVWSIFLLPVFVLAPHWDCGSDPWNSSSYSQVLSRGHLGAPKVPPGLLLVEPQGWKLGLDPSQRGGAAGKHG